MNNFSSILHMRQKITILSFPVEKTNLEQSYKQLITDIQSAVLEASVFEKKWFR